MVTYSIIKKSQLEGVHRLDAEYYQPEYLKLDDKLNQSKPQALTNYLEYLTDGAHKTPGYQHTGVLFLSSGLIFENYIDFDNAKFISEKEDKSLRHCKPKLNDVLISKSGKIGTATVFNKPINCNLFEGVALLRTKNIDPYFLSVFMNSNFGQKQIERLVIGISQPHLHLEQIEKIKIPSVSTASQKNIKEIFLGSLDFFERSKEFYKQAEELLLEELGLSSSAKASEDEKDLSWVVNLSDVKNAKRVDAEYFQPKYEKLVEKLKSQNVERLEQVVDTYSTGFPFKSDNYVEQGTPLIRINNIRKGFIDLTDTAYLSEKDYLLSPKDIAKPGDIVLSMSGTIGMSAVIPADVPKCSANQRILRFSSKNIDSDYLVLVLNSIVGSYQLARIGTGGVQTNISYKDIQNILIPNLSKSTQQKIAELVRKSHEARKKSKELLEEAKTKVEEMIEKGGEG